MSDNVRETRTFSRVSERNRKPVEGAAQSGAMYKRKYTGINGCACNICTWRIDEVFKKKKEREKFRYDFLVYLSKSVVSNGESGEKVTS